MAENALISRIFIEEYMPKSQPVYGTIYIYCLSQSFKKRILISAVEIASMFGVLVADVENCWNYWQEQGLVDIDMGKKNNITIEFLPIKSKEEKEETVPAKVELKLVPSPSLSVSGNQRKPITNKPALYSPEELELYKNNSPEIEKIFTLTEKMLGTLLSSNDLSTVYGFYEWLRLPIDVIESLLEHCNGKGNYNIRYIEKIAIDLAENSISTREQFEDYMQNKNTDYREILKALGLNKRDPATKEIEYMDRWLKEFAFNLDVILEACDRTIIKLGKAQFEYTNTILTSWYQSGVVTLEDIRAFEKNYKDGQAKSKPVSSSPSPKKSKFANYESGIDYTELEKMEIEVLRSRRKQG